VHEVGSAVTNVEVGDTVILHPPQPAGCAALAGPAMTCTANAARSLACLTTAAWRSTCSPRRGRA
jgi:Zn-dependent alcohol dehydrogenase